MYYKRVDQSKEETLCCVSKYYEEKEEQLLFSREQVYNEYIYMYIQDCLLLQFVRVSALIYNMYIWRNLQKKH